MIAPDCHIGNISHGYSGFPGKLALGTIFVQSRHCEPAVTGNIRCIIHGNQAVGIAGITYHNYSYVAAGVLINCFSLAYKNSAVDLQQVVAFHTGFSRN